MYGIVYKITNLANGKLYIGQTTESLNKRLNRHANKTSNCVYLRKAIQKHGKKSFTIEAVLAANTKEELDSREIFCIRIFGSLAPNGYNLISGGNGRKHHPDTKKKMSDSHKGKRKPHSEERKAKISAALKGRPISLETKAKMSAAKLSRSKKSLISSIYS